MTRQTTGKSLSDKALIRQEKSDPFEVSVITCYHIGAGEGTSQQESVAKRRAQRRKERQKEGRKKGFTKYNGIESPVGHL